MAVTINSITQTSPGNWRLDYSSGLGDPTFFIYKEGKLIATTRQTVLQILVKAGDSPVIEIKDSLTDAVFPPFPGRLTLNWGSSPATDHYRVEEFIASVWTLRRKITDDGASSFIFKTRFLEDQVTHLFRIIPVGTNENQGTAENLSILMVRHPDVPTVDFSYSNSTKKLTLTES